MTRQLLSGNQAVAEGVRLSGAGFIAAYPITPQTTIIETLAEWIGRGDFDCEYMSVESEHSAMAACIGASLAGQRTFTATSSQGLALMHEMLHWASGQRVPVVMANVNRALGPPWNIWVDHTDSMAQRDTGWIQLYAETNQEVMDAIPLAYRVAESKDVMLPFMVMQDAFLLSHTYMPVDAPSAETVREFVPSFEPSSRVEPTDPTLFGSFSPPDLCFMELRHDMAQAMTNARERLLEAARAWSRLTGRPPLGLLDEYRTEDADAVVLTIGSMAATARDAVDRLRKEGLRVGLARIRVFRPFPRQELRALARRVGVLGVLERAYSHGFGGPVAGEVRSALLDTASPPPVASCIAGLGGRDVTVKEVEALLRRLPGTKGGSEEWMGLQEAA